MSNPYRRQPPPKPIAQLWRRPSVSDNITVCKICDQELVDPRVLPCMHPFCEECLLLLLQSYERHKQLDRTFPCPTCGKRAQCLFLGKVSSKWLNTFPRKLDIDNLKEATLVVEEMCQPCSSQWKVEQAVKFCPSCRQYMCVSCLVDHKSNPENKSHNVLDYEVKEMKKTSVFNISKFTCKTHSNLRYSGFCEIHNVFLCNTCKEGVAHRGCRVVDNIIEKSGNIIKADTKINDVNNLRRDERSKGKTMYKMLEQVDGIQEKLGMFRERKEMQYCNYVKQATITEQKTEAIDALKGKLDFVKVNQSHDVTYRIMNKVESIVMRYADMFDLEDEKPIKAEINKNLADIAKILAQPVFDVPEEQLKPDKTFVIKGEARYDHEIPSYHMCKKHVKDSLDEESLVKLGPLMKSVGIIRHSSLIGTAFRVGSKYVMTAAHVVRDIIDPDRSGQTDWQALEAKSVYLSFESPPKPDGKTFHLTHQPAFLDDSLNVAVLEVADPSDLPPPLLLSMRDVIDLDISQVAVIGYGHKDSQKKYLDTGCPVVAPLSTRAQQAIEWLGFVQRRFRCNLLVRKKDPTALRWNYDEMKDQRKLAIDCSLEYRAYGAPAIACPDDDGPEVMAIFSHSIPDCFSELPAKAQVDYKDFRFEMATKMSSVYKQMMTETRVLADDIFVRAKDYYGML